MASGRRKVATRVKCRTSSGPPPGEARLNRMPHREEQCRQQRELLARLKQSPQPTAEHYGAIARQQKIVAEQCKG